MPLTTGSRLGAYEIVGQLGAGGMGEVYRARDSRLRRDVAIKVLPAAFAADPDRLARFEQEARAAAALNHPNIVTIHSVEEVDGRVFLTLEYVQGRTLAEIIQPGGVPIDRLLSIGISLADAVGAAHQRGITHRDLKPANVMVANDGRVKVLDFGLAKLREDMQLADSLPKDKFEPRPRGDREVVPPSGSRRRGCAAPRPRRSARGERPGPQPARYRRMRRPWPPPVERAPRVGSRPSPA